jgi:hypothetical protein
MKFFGIEIRKFACFEQQVIPVHSGMNLLVGKNNSGKTAALRCVELLRSLPFPEREKQQAGLAEYCRGDTYRQEVSFSLGVLFQLEYGDPQFIATTDPRLGKALFEGRSFLSLNFDVFPRRDSVELLGGTLRAPDLIADELPVLQLRDRDLVQRNYSSPPVAQSEEIRVGKWTGSTSYQSNYEFLPSFPLAEPLRQSMSVVRIAAHRTVDAAMKLASVDRLEPTANNIAGYLQTLHGRARRKFNEVERFVCAVFPQFEAINPLSLGGSVALTLSDTISGRDIPLTHCGTGVEQIITIATFLATSEPGSIVLMDEPQSFLHPSAERQLVRLLAEYREHRIVIATHSPVFINAVLPSRITHLSHDHLQDAEVGSSRILFDLGHRNSDYLFHDWLVFVEGDSDKAILPGLLLASGEFSEEELSRIGFPVMHGGGRVNGRSAQTSLILYEALLGSLGGRAQPHVYLLDGDYKGEDRLLLSKTKRNNSGLQVEFLDEPEIENYLLYDADALCAAINEESDALELSTNADSDEIVTLISSFRERKVEKGSVILGMLYDRYGLKYDKVGHGQLIARKAKATPQLSQLAKLLKKHLKTSDK